MTESPKFGVEVQIFNTWHRNYDRWMWARAGLLLAAAVAGYQFSPLPIIPEYYVRIFSLARVDLLSLPDSVACASLSYMAANIFSKRQADRATAQGLNISLEAVQMRTHRF